jgi:hypothetical protein
VPRTMPRSPVQLRDGTRGRQPGHRLIQGEHINSARLRYKPHFIERHAQRASTTLCKSSPARMIDKDTLDDLRPERQEMSSVSQTSPVNQSHSS